MLNKADMAMLAHKILYTLRLKEPILYYSLSLNIIIVSYRTQDRPK